MRKFFAFLLVFVLAIAVSIPAFAAPAPVPGNPAWEAKYGAAKALTPSLGPAAGIPNNPRDNASGDKISSNAHSADFPGLYFYWNDKQKDDGVLLVLPEVFDMFVNGEFTLTAKNSNNYWGYTISPATGTLIDGVYAFGIPKQFQWISVDNKGKEKQEKEDLKNINMVFIDGEYKPGYFVIGKVFYNEVGRVYGTGDNNWDWRGMTRESRELPGLYDLVSFNNGYTIGLNKVEIKDFKTASLGKTITVTENDIPGFLPAQKSISVTVKWNTLPTITFNNYKQWANITIDKVWLNECDCDECECADCIEIDGTMYCVVAAPDGVEAEFEINGAAAVLGANKVKEGTYTVSELDIDGWELVSGNDVKVTVAAGGSATVTFFNCEIPVIPTSAKVEVVKQWITAWGDDYDNAPDVTFTDGGIADDFADGVFYYGDFEPGLEVTFEELVDEDAFVTQDADYYYFWALKEVIVENGGVALAGPFGSPVVLELNDGDDYVITFVNEVTRLKKTFASVEVVKEWVTEWGGVYNNIPAVTFTDDGLAKSFDEGVFYYADFANGDTVTFFESVDSGFLYEDDDYTYEWNLVDVLVNGVSVGVNGSSVELALYDGNDYVITFVNEITRLKKNVDPLDINDKIPSKTHVDRWWEAFGVLAYGANSGNDKEIYFLGFSAEFWDVNESVTIAYGTKGKYDYEITITAVEVDGVLELVFTGDLDIAVIKYYYDVVYFDNHYTSPKEKNHEFVISVGADFGNVYESGARQIWLVSIQPK